MRRPTTAGSIAGSVVGSCDECERLAREGFDARAIRVTAGVGVRGYYRNLGYELRAPYMVKQL